MYSIELNRSALDFLTISLPGEMREMLVACLELFFFLPIELNSLDQCPEVRLVGQKKIIRSRLPLHSLDCFADLHTASKDSEAQTSPSLASARWWCLLNSANLISLKCYPDSAFISISLITNGLNYFPSICLLSPYPTGWSNQPHPSPLCLLKSLDSYDGFEWAPRQIQIICPPDLATEASQQDDAWPRLHLRKINSQINWGKCTTRQRETSVHRILMGA